jgi:hypothetical protein
MKGRVYNMKARVLGSVFALIASLTAAPAFADNPCDPTMKIHGLPNPPTGDIYSIGRFDLMGVIVMAACALDMATWTETLHLITTVNDYPLAELPNDGANNLCMTNQTDFVGVMQTTQTKCGVTMYPINYAGRTLTIYGLEGNDSISGGNGRDTIYGGPGNDYLADSAILGAGENPIYMGNLYGESGDDRLVGSAGNGTWIFGGNNNDGLWDRGGSNDRLEGDSGHECCMFDSNDSFSRIHGGEGHDIQGSLNSWGTTTEERSPQCTIAYNSGPQCKPWIGPWGLEQ